MTRRVLGCWPQIGWIAGPGRRGIAGNRPELKSLTVVGGRGGPTARGPFAENLRVFAGGSDDLGEKSSPPGPWMADATMPAPSLWHLGDSGIRSSYLSVPTWELTGWIRQEWLVVSHSFCQFRMGSSESMAARREPVGGRAAVRMREYQQPPSLNRTDRSDETDQEFRRLTVSMRKLTTMVRPDTWVCADPMRCKRHDGSAVIGVFAFCLECERVDLTQVLASQFRHRQKG